MRFQARYNYPDNNVLDEIAAHHGVTRDNVLLGAGSAEILDVVVRHVKALQRRKFRVRFDPFDERILERLLCEILLRLLFQQESNELVGPLFSRGFKNANRGRDQKGADGQRL